jgi:outer membrane protein
MMIRTENKPEMKKISLSAFFIAFCFFFACSQPVTSTQPGTTLTLRQCIETGLANNIDVLQSQLQMESSRIDMKQARLNLLPNLNGSASHDFSQGRSIDPYSNSPVTQGVSASNFGLNSGVTLFNGLALQNNAKENSLAFQASKMDLQQAKDNLTINIILDYLQVLSIDDQLAQARNQAELSAREVERLDEMNKQGAIKPSDLSDLRGQYAGDQLSIINLENSLETAKVNLSSLMNVPYSKDLTLEKIEPESFATKYESTRDQIYQTALQQLALIKSVDLKTESAVKALKVEKGLLFPKLSFGANLGTAYSSVALQNQFLNTTYVPTTDSTIISNVKYPVYSFRDNFTPLTKIPYRDQISNNVATSFGFSLSVPIFNSFFQRNRVKQAKITLQDRQLIAKTTRTQLGQSIDQSYINMVSASDRYRVLLDQVSAFTESYHAAEIRFNNGVGTSVDYLTTKNNLDRSNISLITAKYDYVLRTKILDYYQGKQLW